MSNLHSEQPSTLGGSVGGKLARLVADASVHTKMKLAGHTNQVAQKALADFTNHVSDELREIAGPLWEKLADSEETPEELRAVFEALAHRRGQAFAWMAGSVLGGGVAMGLQGILNNMLAPITQTVLKGDPNLQLPPDQAARAVINGHWSSARATEEAARSGLNAERFAVLSQMLATYPDKGEILELARRNAVTDDRARAMLRTVGMDRNNADLFLLLQAIHISPPDAAAMVNRDILTREQGRAVALKGGVSSEDFDRMTLLGGDPLPPMELGAAYRRGIIGRERFEKGIVQGPLRKEWFDVLEKLQISRMSTVDAADAVNQGYMPIGEARKIAHENGLDPDDFEMLTLLAGTPPGVEFAQDALNRGVISKAEFDVMFKESRIKNRYLSLLYEMRIRLIPQETARLLYRNGVYSREQALTTLLKHGFSAEDAAALLELEEVRGDDATRELTRAQIVDLYESGMFDAVEAVELLLGMGYLETDAQAMIYLADTRNFQRYLNSAITRVRSSFLAGKIDSAESSAQLDRLGVKALQRDDLITLWETDKLTITKILTPAQVRQAWKKDKFGREEALRRLIDQGYDPIDADIFLDLSA